MSLATWTRHEWRQLRLVRRVATLLALAVPFLLLVGAAAAERGWLPGGRIRTWDAATVLLDAAPLVLAAVWGLVAALAAGQALAGARATGTEWLVLSLPVSRRVVWCARLAAAFATALLVAAVSLAFLLGIAHLVVGGVSTPSTTLGWTTGAAAGAVAVGLSILGTAAVAPLVRQPLQAALAGMVAGAAPLGVANWFASAFPYATAGIGPAAVLVPVAPLLPALALASFLAAARGEPAGRGRVPRVVAVIVVALAVGSAAFVAVVNASVRLGRAIERADVWPAPRGDRAVGSQGMPVTRTLYDTRSGEALSFVGLSDDRSGVGWSDDGESFAVVENVSILGRRIRPRLSIRRASDGAVVREVLLDADAGSYVRIHWCGGWILDPWAGAPLRVEGDGVRALVPTSGDDHRVHGVVGCLGGRDLLVAEGEGGERASRRGSTHDDPVPVFETRLLRVSLDGPGAAPEVVGRGSFPWFRAAGRVSPDGRFVLAQAREYGATRLEVLDLDDGSTHALDGVDLGIWGWLEDGRLAWAEDAVGGGAPRVRLWRPGGDPVEIAIEAPGATNATLCVSPDARRVLVRAAHRDGDRFVTDRLAVLDPGSGVWRDLDVPRGATWADWASASAVVLQAPDAPGRLLAVEP